MTAYAQHERRELCDLLLRVGPDAPTLCQGWSTRDLAAHLVVRERRPDSAPGLVVVALAGYTARVQRSVRDAHPWPELVERVRSGPPAFLRVCDEQMNAAEFFVHHEDVRRAAPGWVPRPIDAGEERLLWSRLRMLARVVRRRLPVGVVLAAPDFGQLVVRPGAPQVTLSAPPSELLCFMFGRQVAARVDASGPPDAVSALHAAKLGL